MKPIKDFLCDKGTPQDYELLECIDIADKEDCVVRLSWFFPYNGWHQLLVKPGMTIVDCKDKLPKRYGV